MPPQTPVILESTPEPKGQRTRSAFFTLGIIAAAFAVAFLIMSFVFQSYLVDGPSMQTTLNNNDRLIIWKVDRTIARITKQDYIPNRGDIVVCVERSLSTSDGSPKQIIKRVIGLPGERIVIQDGIATIYNKEFPDGFQPDTTLPYGEGQDLRMDSQESVDLTIPKGEVYVLGDNRNNSSDSRVFGPIEAHDIVGKLVLRVFPLGDAKRF